MPLQDQLTIHPRPVLRRAPIHISARRHSVGWFITRVLEKQGNDPVRWDGLRSKVSHCSAIVGMRPQVLNALLQNQTGRIDTASQHTLTLY